jgi:hypothetical protein
MFPRVSLAAPAEHVGLAPRGGPLHGGDDTHVTTKHLPGDHHHFGCVTQQSGQKHVGSTSDNERE